MADNEILFDVTAGIGRVHLNRPASFNALTTEMCIAFRDALTAWRDDDAVSAVLVTSEGDRAFCAGGDIRRLYEAMRARDPAVREFFWHEYRLDNAVHSFPKPYVAFVDGIAMGGGVGISVNGSHRVLTERTVFAMPETGIGLFPDVGATEFLRRCPGEVGMYLALTGARLKAADAVHAGIGTRYMPSERFADLESALSGGDPIDDVLAGLAADPGPAELDNHRHLIDRIFAGDSVAAILDALTAEDGYWAIETADDMREKSPTSLLVTFKQLREGAGLDFADVMRREYRMACAFAESPDFPEGIRAAVIDKDRSPKWHPARLEDVRPDDVAAYFAPLGDAELDLE